MMTWVLCMPLLTGCGKEFKPIDNQLNPEALIGTEWTVSQELTYGEFSASIFSTINFVSENAGSIVAGINLLPEIEPKYDFAYTFDGKHGSFTHPDLYAPIEFTLVSYDMLEVKFTADIIKDTTGIVQDIFNSHGGVISLYFTRNGGTGADTTHHQDGNFYELDGAIYDIILAGYFIDQDDGTDLYTYIFQSNSGYIGLASFTPIEACDTDLANASTFINTHEGVCGIYLANGSSSPDYFDNGHLTVTQNDGLMEFHFTATTTSGKPVSLTYIGEMNQLESFDKKIVK